MDALPEFRKHGFDRKFEPLTDADLAKPGLQSAGFVEFLERFVDGPLTGLRILDLGCGRGDLVGLLRLRGASAFGIEIDPRFVESGRMLNERYPEAYPVLSTVDDKGRSVFPDGYFDLVVSDQVLEHVADLRSVTGEIARVLRPGGRTCHRFPARHRLSEPHYHMPFVHWLPKTGVRRSAMRMLLRLGYAGKFFSSYSLEDRTSIIYKYSVEETFYRPISQIEAAFRADGLESYFRPGMHAFVEARLKRRVHPALPLPELVSEFHTAMFCARRPPAPAAAQA